MIRKGIRLLPLLSLVLLPAAYPDKLSQPIPTDDRVVALKDIVQVPAASPNGGKIRINYLFHANDGSGRLFVNDMQGQVRVIKDGSLLTEPFLDLAPILGDRLLTQEFELGLGCFAFHPDYARAGSEGFGKLYTVHTERATTPAALAAAPILQGTKRKLNHYDVISEWTVDPADPDRVDPGSQREVLRIAQPWWDHNAGQLAFNPNAELGSPDYGLLYIGVGDGGNTANRKLDIDADRQGQDLSSPLGKILRINPLQQGDNAYTTPADNPFAGNAHSLPEIWAYGLRNPQRFSWDTRGSGHMLIGDIGQDSIEEINMGMAGGNFGWSIQEGTFTVERTLATEADASMSPMADQLINPVLQYDHDEGKAIVGGFVYRGRAIPDLRGSYLFGDIVNGRIFAVDVSELAIGYQSSFRELALHHDDEQTSLLEIVGNQGRADLRFGQDEAGEIYLLSKQDGWIRQLVRKGDPLPAATASFEGGVVEPVGAGSLTQASLSLPTLLTLGSGVGIFVLALFSLFRPKSAPKHKKKKARRRKPSAERYVSGVDNSLLELETKQRRIKYVDGKTSSTWQVDFADIAGFEVIVNQTVALSVSRDSGGLTDEMKQQLRAHLLEVQREPMDSDSVRCIELKLNVTPPTDMDCQLTYYLRKGNRRLTPRSYNKTLDDVISWCERLSTVFTAPEDQSKAAEVEAPEQPKPAATIPSTATNIPATAPATSRKPDQPQVAQGGHSLADELGKLANLWEQGLITAEEFKQGKQKLLGS